jgi:Tol biopolymer transport system component
MRPNALLLLLCLVVCGCGGGAPSQHVSAQILVVLGADYDEPAGQLAVVRDDGSGFHRRTLMSALEARWSPDGRRIAFIAADNFTAQSSVWVMNADGRGQRQLVPDSAGYSRLLEWSPDGRRILYEVASDLWSMRADGSEKRRLARNVDEADWSPDGRSIAFVKNQDIYVRETGAIYVMRADGSEASRVVTHGVSLEWAADGKAIVFARELQAARTDIDAVAATGGKPKRIAALSIGVDYLAGMSPDGRWLLVGSHRGLTAVAMHGGAVHRLTRQPGDYGGDWSPDGRRIAFIRGPNLWLVDAGGNATLVREAPDSKVFAWAWWKPRFTRGSRSDP